MILAYIFIIVGVLFFLKNAGIVAWSWSVVWFLLLIGVAAALYFWRWVLLHMIHSQRESVIISRDLKNAFDSVRAELDKTAGILKKDAAQEQKEMEFKIIRKKIETILEKIENYLSEDMGRLK